LNHASIDFLNPTFKESRHLAIFNDRCPEDWIKWLITFFDIENLIPLKGPADKPTMLRKIVKESGYQ
jgi:hypothetical protein